MGKAKGRARNELKPGQIRFFECPGERSGPVRLIETVADPDADYGYSGDIWLIERIPAEVVRLKVTPDSLGRVMTEMEVIAWAAK